MSTEWLPKVRGVVDVNNRTIVIGPAVNFRVDPYKAERAGFSTQDVANIQAAMLDGQVASDMIRDNRLVGHPRPLSRRTIAIPSRSSPACC